MRDYIRRNGSTILTVLGGVGVVATALSTARATTKALDILEQAEQEKGEKLTKSEKVKVAGPSYIPAVITGAATIACIFGANVLNKRNQAALMSAYALLDNSYKEYKQKLIELYGEETHQNIVDAIAVEKAREVGVRAPGFCTSSELYVDEEGGETRLFYDEQGGRYFESTLEQVISAEYHFNRNYVLRGYTVLNELYDFLGLDPIDAGSELGWANYDDGMAWIEFNHRKVELDDGLECIIIEMPFAPDLEWQEYY